LAREKVISRSGDPPRFFPDCRFRVGDSQLQENTMRRTLILAASILAMATAFGAAAQNRPQQQVTPPEARYWMGATTGAGMMAMMGAAGGGEMGMGDMMRMATGGMPTSGRSVELRLGSSLAASGAPEASHTMPAAAQVNKPIALATPQRQPSQTGPGAPYQPPKGSIKFYWGCGERAGPGQPVTLTYDKLMRGENDPDIAALRGSVDARDVRKPTPDNSRTYADWPNDDRRNRGLNARFPDGASLAGAHTIQGNYGPAINFTLPADKTFMAPLNFSSTAKQPSGAIKLNWQSVARATGYSLGLMTGQERMGGGGDVVMWSSANRPATFIMAEDLAPAEVQRLIGLKAVLAPTTTTCTIPKEVLDEVAKGGDRSGGMLWTTAFGDQFTQVFPERPADPKTTWDQEWFIRVNFKSVRVDMVTRDGVQDMGAMMAGGGGRMNGANRNPAQMSDAEYCAMLAEQKRNQPSVAGSIGEATGIPGGGMLGRAIGGLGKKKAEEPVDPRCAKK
jgi:hypothetical protein